MAVLSSVSVYRVDWDAKKLVPLPGLDGKASFLSKRGRPLLVATKVSPSISADTTYLCWPKPKDDVIVYAVDLLSGERTEPMFKGEHAAYYFSCYVSDYSSEYL